MFAPARHILWQQQGIIQQHIKNKNYKSQLHILSYFQYNLITSILIESGPKLIESFNKKNLIDELYIYTANNKIIDSNFKTPIDIESNWRLKTRKVLGDDELQVFEKEEMCLQE